MLDPANVRDHFEEVRSRLRTRGIDIDKTLEDVATYETARRRLIPELEGLKRQQNTSGDEIARAKRQGKDTTSIQEASKLRSAQIKQLGFQLDSVERQRDIALLNLPNLPHPTVPVGRTAAENVEVRRHGVPREFDFTPQAHWDLGPALGIIDFERGTRVAGARFTVLSGAGARLERALINFMLDLHTRDHGYVEVLPPFMVNAASLTGTVQLCTGDMGFSSAKTYDIEVWLPSQKTYREISSCSNTEAFQARRANLKFRAGGSGKAELLHALNGSGLAVGRTLIAILENL